MENVVNSLAENVGNLSPKDQAFANSLINQFRRKGRLSPKQAPWVSTLLERATTPRPEPEQARVSNFGGVVDLFERAGQKLRWPKVRLQLQDGTPVVLSRAGERSKNPGCINVTDGGPFGDNRWFGRVTPEGQWTVGRAANGSREELEALLNRLADSPAEVAAEYGRLTGNCAFCKRGLEDERSTAVGYGPVCAKNFGLPWGSK